MTLVSICWKLVKNVMGTFFKPPRVDSKLTDLVAVSGRTWSICVLFTQKLTGQSRRWCCEKCYQKCPQLVLTLFICC